MFKKCSTVFQELAATGEQFDMVFIDADKQNYINYYKFLLDHNLLRIDGVICVDNTLFKGRVYLKDSADDIGKALKDFNQFVTNDPRVEQVCMFSLMLTFIHVTKLIFYNKQSDIFVMCLNLSVNHCL